MDEQTEYDRDLQHATHDSAGNITKHPDANTRHDRDRKQPRLRILPPPASAEWQVRGDGPHQEAAENEQGENHRPELLVDDALIRRRDLANHSFVVRHD